MLTTTVRINDPTIIAFHGTMTRTPRRVLRASAASVVRGSAWRRATRSAVPGNMRRPTFNNTVTATDRTTEMTSQRTAPGSRGRKGDTTPGRFPSRRPVAPGRTWGLVDELVWGGTRRGRNVRRCPYSPMPPHLCTPASDGRCHLR